MCEGFAAVVVVLLPVAGHGRGGGHGHVVKLVRRQLLLQRLHVRVSRQARAPQSQHHVGVVLVRGQEVFEGEEVHVDSVAVLQRLREHRQRREVVYRWRLRT